MYSDTAHCTQRITKAKYMGFRLVVQMKSSLSMLGIKCARCGMYRASDDSRICMVSHMITVQTISYLQNKQVSHSRHKTYNALM